MYKEIESMYKELFLKRWRELENDVVLEREDGETTFLEKDVFPKFFNSPELLVGFYVWRAVDSFECAYDWFMEEYGGWIDDCKEIASQAKEIFEREIKTKAEMKKTNEDIDR